MKKINKQEYHDFYKGYVDRFNGKNICESLKKQEKQYKKTISSISKKKSNFRYAKGKWTIAELLLHIIDAERVFSYRALCLARGEKKALPGFEQDGYVKNSKANKRSIASLLKEYSAVRKSTLTLFKQFDKKQLESQGTVSGNPITVRAIGYIILGHSDHHLEILKKRYLS